MSWNPDDPGETVVLYLREEEGEDVDSDKRERLHEILEKHRFEKLAPDLWGTTEFFYDLSTFDSLVRETLQNDDCYLGLFRVNLDLCGWRNIPKNV